jgi:hypothetical protein
MPIQICMNESDFLQQKDKITVPQWSGTYYFVNSDD